MLYSIPLFSSKNSHIPLLISFLGEISEGRANTTPAGSEFYSFFYCLSGEGTVRFDQTSGRLSAGQLLFLEPGTTCLRTPAGSWTLFLIGLTGPCCRDILKTCGFGRSGIYSLPESGSFQRYSNALMEAHRKNADQKLYSSLCYELLLALSGEIKEQPQNGAAASNEIIRLIQEYMTEHYAEQVSLYDIASHVHLTREYICSLYKKETGHTVLHQLTGIRIGRARLLLERYPELKVKEIGAMCGFSSPSYFGKTFLKWVGTSPELYRKKSFVRID